MSNNKQNTKTLKFKKGQTWWFVESGQMRQYQYLCEYPFNNPINIGTYDIIICKTSDQPERIYRKRLLEKIEKYGHIKNYEEAKVEFLKQAEKHLQRLKEVYAPN